MRMRFPLISLALYATLITVVLCGALIGVASVFGSFNPTFEIAYVSYPARRTATDLFVLDIAHGIRHNLTRTPEFYEGAPAWSPDGEWIAFQSNRHGAIRIYIMDKNGRNARVIADQPGTFPRWTRDGSQIVFSSGQTDIYTVTLATGELLQIAGSGLQTTGQVINVDLATDRGDMGGAAAPDGSRIVFMRHQNGQWGIYSAHDRTRAGAQLLVPLGRSYYEVPAWSPDSRQIAYVLLQNGNYDLHIVDVHPDGTAGAGRRLTFTPSVDSAPAWRPIRH